MVSGRFSAGQGVVVHLWCCIGLRVGLLRLLSLKVLVGALKGEDWWWESYRIMLVEADGYWPWC